MPLEIQHFDTPRAFLDALDLTRERWASEHGWKSPWVFRGHSKSQWQLIPRAWRDEGYEILAPLRRKLIGQRTRVAGWIQHLVKEQGLNEINAATNVLDVAAEFEAVWQFVELANELGFQTPMLGNAISGASFLDKSNLVGMDWPFKSWHAGESTVLAQHHGIPTRLLDFTRSSFVAAFFAAEHADGAKSEERLAVWAIRTDLLGTSDLETVMGRRCENSYLHAQDATSIYHRQGDRFYVDRGFWPQFEEFIPDGASRKLTLPHCEAGELLRLLRIKGVSRARLMPTFDNVAETLKTEWRNSAEASRR